MAQQNRSLEDAVGMLCTDIAGTLLHMGDGGELEGMYAGANLVEIDRQGRKIHPHTVELLESIRSEGIVVALVTGMRSLTFGDVSGWIPHDYGIVEHGGIILQNGTPDPQWHQRLQEGISAVQRYKAIVQNRLPVDDANRSTSFRVVPDAGEGLSMNTIAEVLQSLERYIPDDELIIKRLPVPPLEYPIPTLPGVEMFMHIPYPPEFGCFESRYSKRYL